MSSPQLASAPDLGPLAGAIPYAWPLAGPWRADDTALLVIDMQRDFLLDGGYFQSLGEDLSHVRRAIAPGQQVLAAARASDLLIIHTRESHRPDLSDLNATKRLRGERVGAVPGAAGPMGRLLIRGEYGCDFIDEFQPLADEPVIDKPGNSAFHATDLQQILNARQIKRLMLFGITTDVCVSSTLREANDRGYDCLLIEDACGAANAQLHQSVLNGMEREGGIFGAYVTSHVVVQALSPAAVPYD